MKRNLYHIIVLLAFGFMMSCSSSIEEKLTGEWHVTDVQIDADEAKYDRGRIDALRRMEKSVVFVLNEDLTMNAVTGGSTIEGTWSYDEVNAGVYILFAGGGDEDKTLMGNLSGGKITKEHDSEGLVIKTIYEKR